MATTTMATTTTTTQKSNLKDLEQFWMTLAACPPCTLTGKYLPQLWQPSPLLQVLPFGKHTKNDGKITILTGKSAINGHFQQLCNKLREGTHQIPCSCSRLTFLCGFLTVEPRQNLTKQLNDNCMIATCFAEIRAHCAPCSLCISHLIHTL